MKNNLLELNGIDDPIRINFKWIIDENIDGNLEFINKRLLGATISKEIISSKTLNSFEGFNNDNINIFNNLFICSVRFNLSIEYSEEDNFGQLKLLNHTFYKTFLTSLKDYNFTNLVEDAFICDFDLYESNNKIYYYANILIAINEV
ncbi:hypothetical protein [Paraclostridium dentum]|uniref:hypothetical protein n=1 Tax=Paraclostridium dentum TaxID=2662455 RepID=UPI003F39F346